MRPFSDFQCVFRSSQSIADLLTVVFGTVARVEASNCRVTTRVGFLTYISP